MLTRDLWYAAGRLDDDELWGKAGSSLLRALQNGNFERFGVLREYHPAYGRRLLTEAWDTAHYQGEFVVPSIATGLTRAARI